MTTPPLRCTVRDARARRGWSQQQLADRAGLSRAGVSAIETGRLAPSTAAALALAAALDVRVEDLFSLGSAGLTGPEWAWAPPRLPARYWGARVGDRLLVVPVEPQAAAPTAHDGVAHADRLPADTDLDADVAARTLVIAGCDPAAGLLVAEATRQEGLRIVVVPRGSSAALDLLAAGRVHAAGVHLGGLDPDGNAAAVRQRLGPGHPLVHVARWETGVALAHSTRVSSVGGALRARLRWIGREAGSGARLCQDEILGRRAEPEHVALHHRAVASAIQLGYADLGVSTRLVSEESRLRFIEVRREAYELCLRGDPSDDPRLRALVRVLRSPRTRRLLADLPGYDTAGTGEQRTA